MFSLKCHTEELQLTGKGNGELEMILVSKFADTFRLSRRRDIDPCRRYENWSIASLTSYFQTFSSAPGCHVSIPYPPSPHLNPGLAV